MAQPEQSEWAMPVLLNCPLPEGRKPPTIPDTTQFSAITQVLFGVSSSTPDEAFRWGTYNELYLLHLHVPSYRQASFNIPRKVLARVSRDQKTRSDISIESEIATMVFVKQKTSIPVPTVYGYCPTSNNPIGQPFSIISFTEGADMNGSPWEDLDTETKLIAIRDYARIVLELASLHFHAIGSIYFKPGDPPPNCYRLGPVAWCKHESASRKRSCSYDRGPWKTSGAWLRATLLDEIEFMTKLPELAQTAYGRRVDGGDLWRRAQRILPQLQERITDIIDDPLDRCAAGPFVLAHMDLKPENIIFAPEGPNAGRILSVIDWEMATTVPLWALVSYPSWFGRVGWFKKRDQAETQLFKDTYIRELQKHTTDPFILRVVQNARYESKRQFADVAVLPWDAAQEMERWLDQNRKS